MYFSSSALASYALTVLPVLAKSTPDFPQYPTDPPQPPQPGADPFKLYTISADNITATFIPYGARMTSLLVPDRNGNLQDVNVGFDDPKQYLVETTTTQSYLGPVVGRYANRIANGSFEIDGVDYQISQNNKGNALHGGEVGYDQYNWTVTAQAEDSITFSLLDEEIGGFPGDVITHATFSVSSTGDENTLTAKTVSVALNKKTPIMLANHFYWNLNAFKAENILDDTTLQLPLSTRYVGTDGELIPNGELPDVADSPGGVLDFTEGKLVGDGQEDFEDLCGTGCSGIDQCFLVDREDDTADWTSSPDPLAHILSLSSSTTGISMDIATNQRALQIYTCNNQDGTIPVKPSQLKRNEEDSEGPLVEGVNQYGCIVIETEGYIDGINQPEWGQEDYQIFSSETGPAVNWATYTFGTIKE
ncbi:hypothetical protein FQN54_001756 [Arachnomyces sp. PD_36]|nr:hypothetical protein FQN54_001756 [Arachnomyces sp. PD_36]